MESVLKGDQTKANFIDTAARLFQAEGYHAVGLARIIQESGGPKGSFYFHFKGGKLELALAAIDKSRKDVENLLDHASVKATSPESYLRVISLGLKRWLKDSKFAAACPIAGFTIELASSSPEAAAACADAYMSWTKHVADMLETCGIQSSDAQSLGCAIIAAFEGGVVMCRATRSFQPLEQVVEVLTQTCEARIIR